MSKLTQRKSMDYIKKDYEETRKMPGSWYLSNYKYKYNITHLQPFLQKLKEKKLVGLKCSGCNTVYYPPRFVCGKCLVKPDRWVDIRETGNIIYKYSLKQNYPNPFNPTTQIKFQIPESSIVSLKIYNMLGQEVAELLNEIKTAGVYDVTFNAANLASGTYFYRLQSGNFIQTKKLMLIK